MTINVFQRRKNQRKLEEMTPTPLEVTMPRQVAWQARQQLLLEAKEFLTMFHQECGLHQYYLERIAQVQDEIERTGTYWHTYEELAFGARVAWRNSSRCIGRLYWNTLQVVDRRHLSTEEEIFKALVEHIQLATNGGRIQSMMTIFRPSLPGQVSVRIWNPQLIRYAGYRQPDGSVVGDPLHVELTEVIRRSGWQGGEGGPFDILPLVIQLSPRPPRLFELPREHVLEVPLSHPEYPWFAELGLKWHALPVLSSMRLEIGGISYTAAPFNGWYMGTEIGARNLGDVQRYNLLPLIARRMGLDTHSDRTLWRDRAIVELNVAVLSSFARHRVSIVDHHTASRQFVLHQKREEEADHVVPADWGWIVPPISGSTTPVFHTPYTDMTLKPNFFAQKEPWRDQES
ncbi:MAG TPA: nitric oxide synthase oxygenase [Ktedonobacteraceae bacterium]